MKKHNSTVGQSHKGDDFITDYEKMFGAVPNSVIVKTEWSKNGDFFRKLSVYDSNYVPVKTFGGTTLINHI